MPILVFVIDKKTLMWIVPCCRRGEWRRQLLIRAHYWRCRWAKTKWIVPTLGWFRRSSWKRSARRLYARSLTTHRSHVSRCVLTVASFSCCSCNIMCTCILQILQFLNIHKYLWIPKLQTNIKFHIRRQFLRIFN